jgi:hypothetical protein
MANPAHFTWVDPTTNVDGSAIGPSEITGYLIGVRPATGTAGVYPVTLQAPPTATSATFASIVPPLAPGSYQSAIQTLSTSNGNSAWSAEVPFSIVSSPNPPSGFTVA